MLGGKFGRLRLREGVRRGGLAVAVSLSSSILEGMMEGGEVGCVRGAVVRRCELMPFFCDGQVLFWLGIVIDKDDILIALASFQIMTGTRNASTLPGMTGKYPGVIALHPTITILLPART